MKLGLEKLNLEMDLYGEGDLKMVFQHQCPTFVTWFQFLVSLGLLQFALAVTILPRRIIEFTMVFLKTESIIEKAKFSGSSLESGQKEPLKMGKSYDRFAVQVFTFYAK